MVILGTSTTRRFSSRSGCFGNAFFMASVVYFLIGVTDCKVATVHDLGGNYARAYVGGMSFCGEEVRLTANYPNLVQVEFKGHPMKCELPLEFTKKVLNATDPYSDEYGTIVEPRETVLLSGHSAECAKPLKCSAQSINVKLFIPQRNLTMFSITLVADTKYLLLEQADIRSPVKSHCLYYGITSTPGSTRKSEGKRGIGQVKGHSDPSSWVKVGVSVTSIAGFCTVLCFAYGIWKYFRKRNHSSSGTDEASRSEV